MKPQETMTMAQLTIGPKAWTAQFATPEDAAVPHGHAVVVQTGTKGSPWTRVGVLGSEHLARKVAVEYTSNGVACFAMKPTKR
jgi:hypothetical protein